MSRIHAGCGVFVSGGLFNDISLGERRNIQLMKKKKAGLLLRELLFADESLEGIAARASADGESGPLGLFAAAHRAAVAGDEPAAIKALQGIIALPDLETRVCLQAWRCLRDMKVAPPDDLAGKIQGIVVEVPVGAGHDLVAAYGDHTARYYNFAGGGVVWEIPEDEVDRLIDELLARGQNIVNATGIWDQPRPPAPGKGIARVNALTFGGLHFGEGEFSILAADPLGGPAIKAAFVLMQALIVRQQAPSGGSVANES